MKKGLESRDFGYTVRFKKNEPDEWRLVSRLEALLEMRLDISTEIGLCCFPGIGGVCGSFSLSILESVVVAHTVVWRRYQ